MSSLILMKQISNSDQSPGFPKDYEETEIITLKAQVVHKTNIIILILIWWAPFKVDKRKMFHFILRVEHCAWEINERELTYLWVQIPSVTFTFLGANGILMTNSLCIGVHQPVILPLLLGTYRGKKADRDFSLKTLSIRKKRHFEFLVCKTRYFHSLWKTLKSHGHLILAIFSVSFNPNCNLD